MLVGAGLKGFLAGAMLCSSELRRMSSVCTWSKLDFQAMDGNALSELAR